LIIGEFVYVTESYPSCRIQIFHKNGEFVWKWGKCRKQSQIPRGLLFDEKEGLLYVSDQVNNVQVFK